MSLATANKDFSICSTDWATGRPDPDSEILINDYI